MSLEIIRTLHIRYPYADVEDTPTRAVIELDDRTSITVSQLYGPLPCPSFLIEEFTTLRGFSSKQLETFNANPRTHESFARIWEHYLRYEEDGSEVSINDALRARILLALETDQLVLRLEGRKSDILAIGDVVTAHLVFFSYGSVQLGTITDIKLL